MNQEQKNYPKLGEQLYLYQKTGNSWIDEVKSPYTVVSVTDELILIQSAKLIFPVFHYNPKTMSDYYKQFDNQRVCFYDTLAESIIEDKEGNYKILKWNKKLNKWTTNEKSYPEIAEFGKYEYQPYLN